MHVNLIYHDNGAGTPRTAMVVADVLSEAGVFVSHTVSRRPSAGGWVRATLSKAVGRPVHDLNIFLEKVWPAWFPYARRNVLIPNQEWFDPVWLRHLPRFDRVLAKTRHAEARFRALGAAVQYVGFTTPDVRLVPPPPPAPGILHVAGRSLQKGTDVVLETWSRHPEWPTLTVVQRPPHEGYPLHHPMLPNVIYRTERLAETELRLLQNSHRIHLCPSQAEGFGHTLVESMSCGVVLITTDGPPMNELVQPDRGMLVAAVRGATQGVGQLFDITPDRLEEAMSQVLALGPCERDQIGLAARGWFEANRAGFHDRMLAAIDELH